MIQRFYFVKMHDAHVEGREDLAVRLRAELADADIDALVGIPADDSSVKWDLSIAITAASADAWHALARTPKWIAILADVEERAHVMKAWTFQVGSELGE